MLELIRDLGHNKRVNLILSSHLLPDVEFTCDRVVVMDKGTVVAQGPIGELKGPGGRVFEVRVKGPLDGFIAALKESGMDVHSTDEDVMRVFVPADRSRAFGTDQQAICAIAARQKVQVRHLRPSVPTLEDAFAKAVGED
jgi:ABC-2 type transport system ATP-binding protein